MTFDSKTMRVVVRRQNPPATGSVVTPPPAPVNDLGEVLSGLSVAEVIELAQSGMASLDDIIATERDGKGRKTILALVQSESGRIYPVNRP